MGHLLGLEGRGDDVRLRQPEAEKGRKGPHARHRQGRRAAQAHGAGHARLHLDVQAVLGHAQEAQDKAQRLVQAAAAVAPVASLGKGLVDAPGGNGELGARARSGAHPHLSGQRQGHSQSVAAVDHGVLAADDELAEPLALADVADTRRARR